MLWGPLGPETAGRNSPPCPAGTFFYKKKALSYNTGSMTSATLSIRRLIRVRAEDRLVANEPRFQKEQIGTDKKRRKRKKKTRRKMREEEGNGGGGRRRKGGKRRPQRTEAAGHCLVLIPSQEDLNETSSATQRSDACSHREGPPHVEMG